MYNRYIPQADGSYRRSPMREPELPKPSPPKEPMPPPPREIPEPPAPPCRQNCPNNRVRPPAPRTRPAADTTSLGLGRFFRQLLPANFDTEDLLIVLLLLLMCGDGREDQSNALLTLALYLFL